MKKISVLLFLCSLLIARSGFAGECECKSEVDENFLFPETFKSAQLLSKELCLIEKSADPDYSNTEFFAEQWKENALRETSGLQSICVEVGEHINTLYNEIYS